MKMKETFEKYKWLDEQLKNGVNRELWAAIKAYKDVDEELARLRKIAEEKGDIA